MVATNPGSDFAGRLLVTLLWALPTGLATTGEPPAPPSTLTNHPSCLFEAVAFALNAASLRHGGLQQASERHAPHVAKAVHLEMQLRRRAVAFDLDVCGLQGRHCCRA